MANVDNGPIIAVQFHTEAVPFIKPQDCLNLRAV